MSNNYYITTPIYYVNDVPHIGTAYTTLACDVIARFHRLNGKNVLFLTGTDEHGQKVEKSAIKASMEPQQFVDQNSMHFRNLVEKMNFSPDDFIRTSEVRHKIAAIKFWQELEKNGDIYLGKYSGWYSVRDEAFYAESELIADKVAPTGAPVEWIEEPSYFFALSKWQDKLLEFYEVNTNFILPISRRNEVINFVKGGLQDLSISRTSFNWGIPIPEEENHVMYVWLDALTNYISALGYPEDTEKMQAFWPANVHVVGKDILRFHAVYWPAFLMAVGLPLPKCIMAHGWWTNEGQKISKSIGNVIDPFGLVDDFGVDQVRYFLMREVIFGNDGNYSRDNLISRINSELANKIGNLVQRTVSFAHNYNEQKVPNVDDQFIEQMHGSTIFQNISKIVQDNASLIAEYNIGGVLNNIMWIVGEGNDYMEKQAPWKLRKVDPEKMLEAIYTLLEMIRYIGILLQPFTPRAGEKILDILGIDKAKRSFAFLSKEHVIKPDSKLQTPVPIFPRIEQKV